MYLSEVTASVFQWNCTSIINTTITVPHFKHENFSIFIMNFFLLVDPVEMKRKSQ